MEYQLRFSCGARIRDNCTILLQRNNNVNHKIQFIKHYKANELLIIHIITVKLSVVFYRSETVVSFLRQGP